ncbi:hypothetical protein PHLH7_63310 [Pseudomonas sp. Ost2]|nr:hypothetical protein PHLH7_63310 [Pseudomonas sp. Ost2]
MRVNALSGLACETNVRLLRESVLTRSRAFGTVTLRAALNASGLQSFSDESLNADELGGALRDSDPQQLDAVRRSLTEARSALDAIERFVSEQVGSAQGVDLSALRQLLKLALQVLAEYAPDSAGEPETEAAESPADTSGYPRSTPLQPRLHAPRARSATATTCCAASIGFSPTTLATSPRARCRCC